MITFHVKKILIKERNQIKVDAFVDEDAVERRIISDECLYLKEGNYYRAIETEKNYIIFVRDAVRINVDKDIIIELIKEMKEFIDKDDIKSFINCDFDEMINEIIDCKYENEEYIIDKFKYYKNKDNLEKLIEIYKLNPDIVGEYLFNNYKIDILNDLEEKPYKLVLFGASDKVINKYSKGNEEINESVKLLRYLLNQSQYGDVFTNIDDIENVIKNNLSEYLEKLEEEQVIVVKEDKVYLKNNYQLEEALIHNLLKRIAVQDRMINKNEIVVINDVIDNSKIKLEDEQKNAIMNGITKSLSIIAGEAGTGKTTIITKIAEIIKMLDNGSKVEIVALAGKAVSRLNLELKNNKAKTIHRFLKMKEGGRYEPKINKKVDYLIVDEASMIDLQLFSYLLNSVTLNTRIILVGDINQLEPVGLGQVFKDMVESDKITKTELFKNNRQKEDSIIHLNAKKILDADARNIEYQNEEFRFVKCTKNAISESIIRNIKELREEGYFLKDITILMINNDGQLGVKAINLKVVENYFKNFKIDRKFSVGNKVMHTKNNYSKDIYNGEIGTIVYLEVSNDICKIVVRYEEREIEYDKTFELDLAYALTIHKMQGSQNKVILLVVDKDREENFDRNLLYVAITRATEKVVVIGDKETFDKCIGKINRRRNSMLSAVLRN